MKYRIRTLTTFLGTNSYKEEYFIQKRRWWWPVWTCCYILEVEEVDGCTQRYITNRRLITFASLGEAIQCKEALERQYQ